MPLLCSCHPSGARVAAGLLIASFAVDCQLPSRELTMANWEWIRRYRVWEADRQEFLFPENWLEPESRSPTAAFGAFAAELDCSLYYVNLSTVVSKFIGETEKNLDAIFAEAERANAVLL